MQPQPDPAALKFPGVSPAAPREGPREAPPPPARFDFYTWQKTMIDRQLLIPLTGGQVKVLFVLGRFANRQGNAWPSRTTLARLTGLSESSIKRALTELLWRRLLRRRERPGHTTMYTLVIDEDPGLFAGVEAQRQQAGPHPAGAAQGGASPPRVETPKGGAPVRPQGAHPGTQGGRTRAPQNNVLNKPEGVSLAGGGRLPPLTEQDHAARREGLAAIKAMLEARKAKAGDREGDHG